MKRLSVSQPPVLLLLLLAFLQLSPGISGWTYLPSFINSTVHGFDAILTWGPSSPKQMVHAKLSDLNSDGFADMVVAAKDDTVISVVFGDSAFSGTYDLSALDGTVGVELNNFGGIVNLESAGTLLGYGPQTVCVGDNQGAWVLLTRGATWKGTSPYDVSSDPNNLVFQFTDGSESLWTASGGI